MDRARVKNYLCPALAGLCVVLAVALVVRERSRPRAGATSGGGISYRISPESVRRALGAEMSAAETKSFGEMPGKNPVEGRYKVSTLVIKDDDGSAPIEAHWFPQNSMIDFEIPTKHQGAAWCKFRVIMGPNLPRDGMPAGEGETVAAKGVPHVDPGEPIYQVNAGYIVVGGRIPAARGRRSRAGAPGSIMAVWVTPGAGKVGGTERYFLLDWKGKHRLDVAPDVAGAPTLSISLKADDPSASVSYIEVSLSSGAATVKPMPADLTDPVWEFYRNAQNIARRAELDKISW
ncbi:MAG: hypothetical protein ACK4WH_09150 [Phycisphaerales bacterium]